MIVIGFRFVAADDMIDLIAVLVWPVTIVSMVLVFKEEIKTIIRNIRQLGFRSFGIIIDEVSNETGETPNTQPSQDIVEPDLERSRGDAILRSWQILEMFAKIKLKKLLHLSGQETRDISLDRPIDYLQYTGVFTPSENRIIYNLRLLRNLVAHNKIRGISSKRVYQYKKLVAKIRQRIDGITVLPNKRLAALTSIMSEINLLIDSGKFHDISISEVYKWIENEDILPSLAQKTEMFADFSPFFDEGPYSEFMDFYHEQMKKMWNAYAGNERRKWGIQNMGLCLLLAWTNELIQQGSGWYPNDM